MKLSDIFGIDIETMKLLYTALLTKGDYEDAERFRDLCRLEGVPEDELQAIQDKAAGFSDTEE